MPLVHRTNNRVAPANNRSVDVARKTIQRLLPAQARRYDNAFRVQGFQAILYQRLTCGDTCLCQSRNKFAGDRLDAAGNASYSAINSLLTNGEFAILPYGANSSRTPQHVLEVDLGPTEDYPPTADLTAQSLPSMYETDNPVRTSAGTIIGAQFDRYSSDPDQPGSSTILPDGMGINGPVGMDAELEDLIEDSPVDLGFGGSPDYSCPICFGSGYVGGYSVYNGYRKVLTPNSATYTDGSLDLVSPIPYAQVTALEWKFTLPMGAVGVDALRVWDRHTLVTNPTLLVDGNLISSEAQLQTYCDGRPHVLRYESKQLTNVSHLELQVNLSTEWANFEFPKLTKGSTQTQLENTEPFSIVVSPLVPRISPLDVIYETSYNKYLLVKSVPTWNTQNRAILGWESEVRPTQPQELFRNLPSRKRRELPYKINRVVTNYSGNRIS